ncbi:MAG TPA: NAD(P)/FAD-dependent oxidoreductase [Herpetosiphonaceae bacterium]
MTYDALVIGGSFAGLSAAIQIARARRSVCVVDAGLPRNRFADASHGFFGQDGLSPRTMIEQAREKLLAYPSVTFIGGSVESAQAREGDGFDVGLASGDTVSAKKLILAFGMSDILPDIPGLAERWGKRVLHCPYCHGFEFGGERLGVLNLTPMSSHQAILISDWGPTTFFLNGRDDLDDETRAKLAHRKIAIEPAPVTELAGDLGQAMQVVLDDGRSQTVDALFIGTRTRMNSTLAEQLGCAVDDGPFGPIIRTDAFKLTTVPGVYAAGDIARVPPNATFASADGVTAGVSLHRDLLFGSLPA